MVMVGNIITLMGLLQSLKRHTWHDPPPPPPDGTPTHMVPHPNYLMATHLVLHPTYLMGNTHLAPTLSGHMMGNTHIHMVSHVENTILAPHPIYMIGRHTTRTLPPSGVMKSKNKKQQWIGCYSGVQLSGKEACLTVTFSWCWCDWITTEGSDLYGL